MLLGAKQGSHERLRSRNSEVCETPQKWNPDRVPALNPLVRVQRPEANASGCGRLVMFVALLRVGRHAGSER